MLGVGQNPTEKVTFEQSLDDGRVSHVPGPGNSQFTGPKVKAVFGVNWGKEEHSAKPVRKE